MNFSVKPIVGGFSFKVLSDTLGEGIYIWVDLYNSTISAFDGSTEVGSPLAHASLNSTGDYLHRWHRVYASVDLSKIESAEYLLNNLWVPMTLQSNTNYTGCFWEALTLSGAPGLGAGTSLCHAWSSGPTAELTRHVLGIQAVTPGFRKWRIAPQSLGLNWARGSQSTTLTLLEYE
jgi:hypothetical protein